MRLCDFPSAAPSFCDKFQEIYFGTNPAGRVSGYGSKSKNSDFVYTFRKGEKKKNQCLEVCKMQDITLLDLTKLPRTL